MVLGQLAAVAKAFVKVGKNMALRIANQQAGGVVHTVVIEGACAWTDEGIDALWRLLGDWFKRKDEQHDVLQTVADATPAELQAAVEEEAVGVEPEVRERLVELAQSFRTAIVIHCDPPNAKGQSILRRDFSIQTREQLAALLLPATRPAAGFDPLRAGELVAERYRVVRILGRGGMGIVYLVDNLFDDSAGGDGDRQALKMIRPDASSMPGFRERFLREGRLSQTLRNDNIVAVHDVAYDRGRKQYYLSMEYLGGQALDEWLAARRSQPVTLTQFHTIVNAICDALAYAHRKGVIHLDIKPKNVIVSDDLREVKLLDFGLAKVFAAAQVAMTQADGGTAYYMAPEVLNDGQAEPRSDQYSLAVLCYELLLRRKPVAGGAIAQQFAKHRADVSPAIAKAIERAMMPEPHERFESIEKFRMALNDQIDSHEQKSCPPQVLTVDVGSVRPVPKTATGSAFGKPGDSLKPAAAAPITLRPRSVGWKNPRVVVYAVVLLACVLTVFTIPLVDGYRSAKRWLTHDQPVHSPDRKPSSAAKDSVDTPSATSKVLPDPTNSAALVAAPLSQPNETILDVPHNVEPRVLSDQPIPITDRDAGSDVKPSVVAPSTISEFLPEPNNPSPASSIRSSLANLGRKFGDELLKDARIPTTAGPVQADHSTPSRSDSTTVVPNYAGDAEWCSLKASLDTNEHELELARQQYGERHPRILQLQANVVHLEKRRR